jgi:hypothetical protein
MTSTTVTRVSFLVEDLMWLREFLTNFSEGNNDSMTMNMDIAKEVLQRTLEPAVKELGIEELNEE